jgi:hypothetical protein
MTCWGFLIIFQCTQPAAVPPAARFCQTYTPVYWSRNDTRLTKEAVDRNNRKFEVLCNVR